MSETTEMKPWQKGYELDFLKEKTAPFKRQIKPLCNGAFGCPNEQAVAAALADEHFVEMDRAAAIAKTLKVGTCRHDFAGRDIPLQKDDRIISAIAWGPDGMEDAKALIRKEQLELPKTRGFVGGPALWLITHQDREDLKQVLVDLKFELVSVQVSAGSDVMGVYAWGPGKDRAKQAAARISNVEAACIVDGGEFINEEARLAIVEELKNVREYFAQHYSSYNKKHSWTAFALAGYDMQDPTFIIKPSEMSKKWKAENPERLKATHGWTPIIKMMPAVKDLIAALPGDWLKIDRCRFMRLAPGGELTRHADITDRDAGVADGKLARLHIPIITDEGCQFTSWDLQGRPHRGHMPQRHLCYLDQRKPHACKNESESERIHFVVDIEADDEIREIIEKARPIR